MDMEGGEGHKKFKNQRNCIVYHTFMSGADWHDIIAALYSVLPKQLNESYSLAI